MKTGRAGLQTMAVYSGCLEEILISIQATGLGPYIPDSNKFTLVRRVQAVVHQPSHYGTQGVSNAANYPKTRNGSPAWVGHDGSLWMFGGYSPATYLNDMWRYIINHLPRQFEIVFKIF